MSDEIAARLTRMRARIESLPETPTRPTPTLDVVRHGHEENYWNRLLTYFLTPTEPHQLGTAVLEAFLSAVEAEHPDFDFSRLGFEEIEVRNEVGTGSGIADLIIHVEGEWFLWIEMKVRAAEHEEQTTGYVDEPTLGDGLEKADFPETGRHYVFLADESKTAEAPAFETIGWQSVVRSFERLLGEYGQFPVQSLAQLNDFCRTIRNETGMSKEKENRDDLAALAVEYANEIERVDDALQSYSDELQETWAEQLTEQPPDGWDSDWKTDTRGQYIDMYRENWRVPPPEDTSAYANNARAHLRLQSETSPEKLKRGFVRLWFQVTGADETLVDKFYSRLHQSENAERIEFVVSDISEQVGKNAGFHNRPDVVHMKIVDVECDYDLGSQNGYVSALRTALEDLQPVIELVDNIYEETVIDNLETEAENERS